MSSQVEELEETPLKRQKQHGGGVGGERKLDEVGVDLVSYWAA